MKIKKKGRISSEDFKCKGFSRKLNLFEVHVNRSKHQVLGRQLKSDRGLPGVSRNKALMKRKKTLLQEYKIRGKCNQFIDQRIGERNKSMTEDDRVMARFAAERMRSFNKKAMFNLSDTEVLTHKGQTLSEIERFEDTRSDDEDGDEGRSSSGALKGKFVESAHFGNGMLMKSKQDRESLIDELINESKKRKAERQRNKEETLVATEQLDEEWKTLGMIVTSKKDATDAINQMKDQYDIVIRQLKFEPQGQQASKKLKTEEEVALKDREQLEKLEKERQKQLREIELNKYGSHKSADDLDEEFEAFSSDFTENLLLARDNEDQSEEESGVSEALRDDEAMSATCSEGGKEKYEEEVESGDKKKSTKPKICPNKENNTRNEDQKVIPVSKGLESEEDNEMEIDTANENHFEDSSEEEYSDEEYVMDDLTDLMPSINDEVTISTICEKVSPQRKTSETSKKQETLKEPIELDLPFVLNVPENYELFRDLIRNRTSKQLNVVFERLVKSNHPSLEGGNKRKMLMLAGYIIELASQGHITWKSLPVLVSQFNVLKEFNKEECLKLMVASLSTKLEHLYRNSLAVHEVMYLTWYILVFPRPQGLDVLVPVNTPALSLACRLVSHTHQVTLGLLCCYLLLQDAKISSRVYPEAITYLNKCVKTAKHPGQENSEKENKNPKSTGKTSDNAQHDYKLYLDSETSVEEEHKVLYCSVSLLSDFVKAYRKYPQSKIMFKHIQDSVANLKVDPYPPTLRKEIFELQTQLKVLRSANLPSLAKSAKQSKALRQYEPSFHTVCVGKSQRGIPAEQQEEQKLFHKYKHEMKGAMRELRRDRVFLASVKLKEEALGNEQRMKKVKEIFSSAAAQQGELRSLKRKR